MWPLQIAGLLVPVLLLVSAAAQTQPEALQGMIHGTVIGQDGMPAAGITLAAQRRDLPSGGPARHAVADKSGNYCFEKLPLGKYLVIADDEKRGYASYSTAPHGTEKTQVTLTVDNPEAELSFQLPPRGGFLSLKLIDAETGALIPAIDLTVTNADASRSLVFREESPPGYVGSAADRATNIPSNRDLLLHVSAKGYREWDQSVGVGKPIHVAPGEWVKMEVHLQPE